MEFNRFLCIFPPYNQSFNFVLLKVSLFCQESQCITDSQRKKRTKLKLFFLFFFLKSCSRRKKPLGWHSRKSSRKTPTSGFTKRKCGFGYEKPSKSNGSTGLSSYSYFSILLPSQSNIIINRIGSQSFYVSIMFFFINWHP